MDLSKILHEVIDEREKGCLIHVWVKIGNNNMFPAGINIWKKRIEIEVNEAPLKGKANRKIIEIMKKFFDNARVEIVYGKRSREKGIFVELEKDKVIEMIKNGL